MMQLIGCDDIDEDGNFMNKEIKGLKFGYEGIKFKFVLYIDQMKVYEVVFNCFRIGGCVGIFLEGGFYDRIELFFLKVGVVIMVFGVLVDFFDIGLKIVFVGMNYFYVYKFCF